MPGTCPIAQEVNTELEHLAEYLAIPDDPYLLKATDEEYAALFAGI